MAALLSQLQSESSDDKKKKSSGSLLRQLEQSPSAGSSGGSLLRQFEQESNKVQPAPAQQPRRSLLQKVGDIANKILSPADFVTSRIAEYALPDTSYFGEPETNVRQDYLARNPLKSSGNATVDKAADVVGQLVGPFVGTAGTGIAGLEQATGQAVTKVAPKLTGALERNTADRLPAAIAKGAGRALVTGVKAAPAAAAANIGAELASGQNPTVGSLAKSGAEGAALGVGLGAAGKAIGEGVGTAVRKAKLNKEIRAFIDRTKEPNAPQAPPVGRVPAANKTTDQFIEEAKQNVGAIKPDSKPNTSLGITPFAKRAGAYDNLKTSTKSQLVTKTSRDPLSVPEELDRFYTKMVDNLNRLNTFDKTVERVSGKKLSPNDRSYMLALNSRGNDMIAKQIAEKGMVDAEGNVTGNSLKSVTSKIPKGKYVDFEDYLINKHAITRMARGEKVFRDELNMTPEKSAAEVARYEARYPEFKQLADEYYQFRHQLAENWLVKTGLIKPEQLAAWEEANPYYVPMKRKFSSIEKPGTNGKVRRGFANQSSPVKKYSKTGSQRQIISPIESTLEDISNYVKAAKRGEVMQAVIRNLSKNPEDLEAFAELVPMGSNMNRFAVQDINKILEEDGIDGLLQQFDDQFMKFNKEDFNRPQTENVVTGLVNGEKIPVKINDPGFFEALTNLNPVAQNELIRTVGQVTRMMKVLTTGINPVFSLTRNIFRDIPEAYKNSKTTNNLPVFAKDLVGAWVSVIRNGDLYQSFKNVGGGHASPIAADRNLLAQSKARLIPAENTAERLRNGRIKFVGALENLNNAVEAAPRLAEFKRAVKQGGNTPESRIKGLYEANDVTTNFNRYGNIGKQIDAFLPYFNAAIQGLDKWVRSYKDNPIKAVVKSFTAVTVPTVVLYAINHNDPNYQKLSNYTKDNYFVFPKGDGTFFKIPKPRETGTVFSTLVERALRQWGEQDPRAFENFATTVINNFAPPGVQGGADQLAQGNTIGAVTGPLQDTIAGPLMDLATNKNFAGASIVPGYLQGASPRNQYDVNTSGIAKRIGNALNMSPKQIDYLIRSYGGVIGQLGIPATSQGASIGDTLIRQITVDPTFSNDIMDDFYSTMDKLNTANTDYQQTGIRPKGYDNGLRLAFGRTSRQLSDLRKQSRAIESNPRLTAQQKKQKMRDIQIQMNERALKTLSNAQPQQKGR